MELFTDENQQLSQSSRASGKLRPPLGAPAAALGCAEPTRRALGDISNSAGAASGGGKAGAAALARRALGDITNSGAAAAQCTPAPAVKAGGKVVLPAELAALPISERTAAFVTEEVLALARIFAAEGTEQLAGLSGREQQSRARAEEEAQAQAALEQLLAPHAWGAAQARASRPPGVPALTPRAAGRLVCASGPGRG